MGQTGEHAPQSPDFKVDPNSIGGRAIAWFRRYRERQEAKRVAERQARPPLGIAMPGKPWDKLTPEEREAQWTRFDRASETVLGMTGQLATRALEPPGVAMLRNAISKNLRERYGVRRADSLAQQIASDRVYRPMERRIIGVRGETLPSIMQNLESGIWPGMKVAVLPEYTVSRAGSGYFTGAGLDSDYPGIRMLMKREAVLPNPRTRTVAEPVDVGSESTGSLFDPRTVRTRREQVANRVHRAEVRARDEDIPLPFDPIDTSLQNAVRHADHMDYFYVPVRDSFRYARTAQWPYILEEQDSMRFGPKTSDALRHQTRKRLEDRYREMIWEGGDRMRELTRDSKYLIWDPEYQMVRDKRAPDFLIKAERLEPRSKYTLPYADSPRGVYPKTLRDLILENSWTRYDHTSRPVVFPGQPVSGMLVDTYGETQILREVRDTDAVKAFLFDGRLKDADPKTLDRAQGILRERGIPYDVYNNAAEEAVLSTEMGAPFRQDAKGGEGEDRFAMSRNFLAKDEVPDTIFGIPIIADENSYTPEDLAFFREHPEAGGYYDMGEETPEDGSAEGAPTQADEAGDTSQHGGLTVQQKLERADELLKKWEGTDRYDEFKKRVDEMHAKYGQPAQQPGQPAQQPGQPAQQPGTSYLQEAEKATPWVKQGINTLYNIAAGGGGTDMGISQVLDTVHDTYQSASQSVVQAGRNKIAKFVADAGKQAAAGVGEGTLKEAGFAREVAENLGRRGDIVLKQGVEGATEQAANLYKGANDMKKTATGLEETAKAAKAAASRQARVKAMNHVIDTGYQQTLKTAARKAGIKAATKVGVQLGAKAVASSVGPAAIAAGAVESAVRQGADLADTMKNTGATWSDVGKATGDVFTTKQGWKNLGWGLLGSLKDVASSVTLGAVGNGDKLRERMMDAKGGKARGRYPGKLNNPGNVEKRVERRRGEIASPHKRWAKFATPQDGLREMADVIRQIADVKLAEKDQPFTIRNFAETYAPRFNEKGEPENDTDKYIRDISSTSGIGADTVLDRWNTDDMARLMKAIVRFESGVPHSEWFTDDEYRTAARELEEGATD